MLISKMKCHADFQGAWDPNWSPMETSSRVQAHLECQFSYYGRELPVPGPPTSLKGNRLSV